MWFVGIVLLAVILVDVRPLLPEEERTAFLASLVVRFSSVALVSIGIVALTGTFNSLFNLEHLSDLWTSGYGALLSTKIVLFLFVLALGAINHFFVRRRFQKAASAGEPTSTTKLFRRTIGLELALALSIFAITGAMAGSARTRPSASADSQMRSAGRSEVQLPEPSSADQPDKSREEQHHRKVYPRTHACGGL